MENNYEQQIDYHKHGKAVDIECPVELPIEEFAEIIKTIEYAKGIGINYAENFVHVDCRDKFRQWEDYE